MIERFEVMIYLLETIDWTMISAIIALCVGIAGILFTHSQIRETKRNKQIELCTYFYNKFEDMNKDETIVKFREYISNLSFIDKCKDECVYEGKDEIEIPKEVLEKILVDYGEKFRENAPLDKICNFFEVLGILTKEKYIPIKLIDQFFGDAIVFSWIGLYPLISHERKPYPGYIERMHPIEHQRKVYTQFEYLFNAIIERIRLQISKG